MDDDDDDDDDDNDDNNDVLLNENMSNTFTKALFVPNFKEIRII